MLAPDMDHDTLSQLRAGRLAGARRLDLSCGLTEFPPEIYDLADSLEILNLSGNRLDHLPHDLPRLHRLRVIFCSDNLFTALPEVLGACPRLETIGFKANRISHVPARALPGGLRWLILTDNAVTELPEALGQRPRLQKLMLAGNRLDRLPDSLAASSALELIRIAANRFAALPPWLGSLPRLAWVGQSGNPCIRAAGASGAITAAPPIDIQWNALALQQTLGEGASGVIYRALQRKDGRQAPVAVKVFKGAVTSDGLPQDEMAACMAAGQQPHLIGATGRVVGHPDGRQALVMPLVDPAFSVLAGPPSLDSCTRDIYAETVRFSAPTALRLVSGIASAASHLHATGLLHGDLYAHNILWEPSGAALLGDFGAASFIGDNAEAQSLRRVESRAFGCLVEEVLQRCEGTDSGTVTETLSKWRDLCLDERPAYRPLIADVHAALQKI